MILLSGVMLRFWLLSFQHLKIAPSAFEQDGASHARLQREDETIEDERLHSRHSVFNLLANAVT